MTHPHESPPQPVKHPAEDEVELYEESEDVPGELSTEDLLENFADLGLAQELNLPLDSLDDNENEDNDGSDNRG